MDEVEWTHRHPKAEDLRVGLISWAGTYLTSEPYKNTITATAKSLGKRQTWELLVSNEHDTQAVVRLKSLQGLYLLCEGDGTVCYGRPRTSHHGCFLLRFHRNGKWTLQCIISGRYLESDDAEVYAASERLTPMSLFQFECDSENLTLQLRSANGYYLAQRRHRTVMANGHPLESETFFRMHWNCGRIILQSSTGCFLGIAGNGLLMANATIPGRYGYVGSCPDRDLIQCNMDQPDCIHLLPCRQGIYHFQAQGGSFWSITSFGTFRPWGKFALNFCIELQGSNLLTVLAPNGFYMRADRSGTLLADSEDITKECIWEF
ncbi:Fascin-3 [Tupaia chinensis]|uniref:Fascin-3 n=1 Tax=Tupaia chinensis TaxID=246437 RepID=L9KX85_TUPCH|nr:Fascin-3 [Tupaia chinensis]